LNISRSDVDDFASALDRSLAKATAPAASGYLSTMC